MCVCMGGKANISLYVRIYPIKTYFMLNEGFPRVDFIVDSYRIIAPNYP